MAEPSTPLPGARGPLGVVIVNYGSPELVRRHALAAPVHLPGTLEPVVVVVDNFSSTENRGAAAVLCAERGAQFLPLETNAGFGTGANAGARAAVDAGCSAVVFLNPDAEVAAATLAALHDDVLSHPRTMVSPVVLRPDASPWFVGADLSLRDGTTRRAGRRSGPDLEPWLSGACLVVSTQWWCELGGFDEDYFLYWEDVDLSHRCLAAGGGVRVRDDLFATHAVGGTQGSQGKSPTYLRYNCRNRLLFAAKHLPPRRAARWVAGALDYAVRAGLRGGSRSSLTSLPAVTALVAGTWEGVVLVGSALIARVRHSGRTPGAARPTTAAPR